MKSLFNMKCNFCGNVCDDILVQIEEGNFTTKNTCKLGYHKFLEHPRIEHPVVNGKKVSYDEAIETAGRILSESKKPLLYGWASTVNEAIKIGVSLAEMLGGVYDNTSSVCHAPTTLAIQEAGIPSASLGQIKNRADLLIFWGCNPMSAHPRHPTRYSVFPKGFFVSGRRKRHVVVVDVRKTKTAVMADEFIQIPPNSDYLIISALRAILRGEGDKLPDEICGIGKDVLNGLVERMKSAGFGALLYGLGMTQSAGRHKNVENAIRLVQELNSYTRFVLQPMRGHFNVVGADQVPTWEVGYPFAIDFSRGYARFSPSEYAVTSILNRGDCDSALIIASDPVAHLPMKAVRHLSKIPVIQIDPHPNLTTKLADVVIPSAIVGIEAEGTVYRMDGIPMHLEKFIDGEYLTDEEILERIYRKVVELRGDAL